MGVQGLTTYVEGKNTFLQDVKFRGGPLVIDGSSLYYRLYLNQGFDRQHGGDYADFAGLLNQFLSALAACNIKPYVVLDGGIDPSDKKFPTLLQRLQSKIREADNLSQGRNGCVLPILTRAVFIQVLHQRGVPLVQCPFEADREIACLAHHWKCPVLTNDSDFFIFDLPGGYLPLSFFQWTNLRGPASKKYIAARSYTTKGLCHYFGDMNQELLPLLAVLMGNDYCTPKGTEALLSLLDVNASRRGVGRGKGGASRIDNLLRWLSSFSSASEALEEVGRLLGEAGSDGDAKGKRGQEAGLSSQLRAGMQEYHITAQSSLARWFSKDKVTPGGQATGLPECLSLAAAQGLLNPLVGDAVVLHRTLLIPQVENRKLASSHCSARAIRQAVYGILLERRHDVQAPDVRVQGNRGGRGGSGRGGRGKGSGSQGFISQPQQGVNVAAGAVQAQGCSAPVCVEEYDRLDLNMKKNRVEARPPITSLHLETLDQAPVAVRRGALLNVLGIKESALDPVPHHLRLAVAVTGYWLKEATPKPSQHQLQALVLGMVDGELSQNYHSGASNAESSVLAGLDRLRVSPRENRLDLGAVHSFSQWQACLWSALCLNQLLLLPVPEPKLSGLFSGTLVHGLHRYLKGGHAAESLLNQEGCRIYSSLLDTVRNCSSKSHPLSSAEGRGKRGGGRGRRGRGRGGRGARGGGQGNEKVTNRFALLTSD